MTKETQGKKNLGSKGNQKLLILLAIAVPGQLVLHQKVLVSPRVRDTQFLAGGPLFLALLDFAPFCHELAALVGNEAVHVARQIRQETGAVHAEIVENTLLEVQGVDDGSVLASNVLFLRVDQDWCQLVDARSLWVLVGINKHKTLGTPFQSDAPENCWTSQTRPRFCFQSAGAAE